MKYAVCFRGIHYLDPIKTYQSVDYTNSYNNNKEFLLDEINSSYDIFICSYHSIKEKEMLDTYKPVLYSFSEFNPDENGFKAQLMHHLKCCQMITNYEEKNNIKYDMILITRFDYVFFKKISEMNIDFKKFNIAMKHLSGNCDDNFWLFPRNMLEDFINAIIKLYNTGLYVSNISFSFIE